VALIAESGGKRDCAQRFCRFSNTSTRFVHTPAPDELRDVATELPAETSRDVDRVAIDLCREIAQPDRRKCRPRIQPRGEASGVHVRAREMILRQRPPTL
jgi:hypothetical protein